MEKTEQMEMEKMVSIASHFFDHITVDKDDSGNVTRILMWCSSAWGENDPLVGAPSVKN